MKYKNYEERKLLNRFSRNEDGSIVLDKPYCKATRDEAEIMFRDCLAFERDLSGLPPLVKEKYLAFEKAYTAFYHVWTGSIELPSPVSKAMDLIQSDMESLRKEIDNLLEEEEQVPLYSPRKKVQESPY